MHKSIHIAYSQQSDTVQQSNPALQGPTSKIRQDLFMQPTTKGAQAD